MNIKNTFILRPIFQMKRQMIWFVTILFAVILMANLGAIIDSIFHPEIEYFDSEHILVGMISAFIVGSMLVLLVVYIERLKKALKDITQGEEKKRQSEDQYQTLLQTAIDGFWLVDVNGKLLQVNETYCRMSGYTKQELLSMRIPDLESAETADATYAHIQTIITKGEDRFESRHRRKDGTFFDVEVSVQFKDIGGGRFVTFLHDISARKQVDAQNRMMKHSLDVYTDGIYWMDSDNKFVYVNEAGGKAFGCTPEEIIGKSLYDFNPTLSPEKLDNLWHKLRTDGTFTAETVHRKVDGSEFFVEVRSVYLQYEGKEYNNGYARDITDRKRTELAVQKSEYRYRHLVETMADGVYKRSHEGKFIEVNPAMAKILGYDSVEELMAIDIKTQLYFEEGDRDSVTAEEELTGRSEYRLKKKDGSEVWVEDQGRIILDDDKNILYHEGVLRDITERKRAENLIRESEEKYRLLYESNQMPIAIFDAETLKFLSVNNAFVNKYGYTREEFITMTILDIRPDSEIERVKQSVKMIDEGLVKLGEYLHKKKNGEIIRVEIIRYDLVFEGKNAKLVFANDISESKQIEKALVLSNERLALAQRSASAGVWDWDMVNGKLDWTMALYSLFGLDPAKYEATFDVWKSVIHPDDVKIAGDRINDSIRDHKPLINEYRIVKPSGEIRWIKALGDTTYNERGEALSMSGICLDITEQKISEQALRNAQKLESIGMLAGGIAHDFNNLMNAVLGQSSLALNKLPKESPAADNIQKAIMAGERVADLTRQLLAYSGKGKFYTVEIDLNNLVKENVRMLEVSIPKTAKLRYELDSPSPHINGDIGQIQQVVMNLIINAGEAMDPNSGTITVHTGRIEIAKETNEYSKYTNAPLEAGSYALLQVKDNGSGMSEETLTNIFDPFFTTKFTGRGLGLSAVLGIIKGHKGGLRIESEVGEGTMFEIVWPLIEPSKISKNTEKKTIIVNGEGKTILVIDDESTVIELLDDVLSEANFKVISALDPLKGIELYRRDYKNISLVILDYSMPHIDGKVAFEKLLQINKQVKVLLCSGYTEEETMSVFGIDRPFDFFQKPYKPEALVQRVGEIVSNES